MDSYADFLYGRFPSSLPLFLLRGKVGCAFGLLKKPILVPGKPDISDKGYPLGPGIPWIPWVPPPEFDILN